MTKREPWVSLDEIVRHLSVSRDTVYRWIDNRGLPAHKVGRLWKFKVSEVDEWVRAGQAGRKAGGKTMTPNGIKLPRERISAFCRANGIRRLAIFGSVLRDDFRPESDVDVLVEFRPGVRVGLAFIRMQDELSAILGHEVDLNTSGSLSKYFRDEVLNEAEELYVAA